MKAGILICIALLALAEARVGPQGLVYQFPISATLQCRRVDDSGQLNTLGPQTIPMEPGAIDEVWLPTRVPFAAPPGTIDANMLLQQLPDFDQSVQSVFEPVDTACGDPRIVFADGSAITQPPVSRIDNIDVIAAQDQLDMLGFSSSDEDTIASWWTAVGFPGCDVPSYQWTRLPDYYFPQYYCGGMCSGANCSVPLGQNCRPSLQDPVEMPVLRWDCCWDTDGEDWQWACGWIEVRVQIITACRCACRNLV